MKTVPIILSLAASAAAQKTDENAGGNIRAASTTNQEDDMLQTRKLHPLMKKQDGLEAREARSKRKVMGDHLHRSLERVKDKKQKEEGGAKVGGDSNKTKRQRQKKDRELKKHAAEKTKVQAGIKDSESKTVPSGEKGQDLSEEERELKKAKSDKGGWGGGYDGGYSGGWDGPGQFYDDDDHFRPGWGGDSHDSHDNYYRPGWGGSHDGPGWGGSHDGPGWGGKSDKGGWGGSWGGKSGKGGDWGGHGGWGSGKSGKGGNWGSGKSGKGGWGGGGWGSGKSGKGGDWDLDHSDDYHGGWCQDHAHVRITNLSYEQSFSEIFVMTHARGVTERHPIYEFGNQATKRLAELAQDADASEMQNFYQGRFGVETTKIFRDFSIAGFDRDFLGGGQIADFEVRTHGLGHRLSIAVGLPFTNDGAVVLQNEAIYDGAEYYLPAIDAGVEGNIGTCWSVAAMEKNFPFRSQCAGDDLSDENDNDIPGESFISMHRGVQDLDDRDDIRDLLFFPTCKEFELDDSNTNDRYAEYFYLVGFDDDLLLCANAFGSNCDPRDDQDFLDFLDSADDFVDDRFVRLALQSNDFDDFCDLIEDVNDELRDVFKVLEPWLFDWRNEMMKVEIYCGGWHADGWGNDGFHGDHGNDWSTSNDRDGRFFDDDDDDNRPQFNFNN